MTTYKKATWWIWPVLAVGLLLVGSCGDDGPTIPDPTDVKDYSEGGGGDIGQEDLGELVVEYQTLRDAGGGVKVVADVEDHSLIATFDRWSKAPLDAYAVIDDGGEAPIVYTVPGVRLVQGLEFPITITVFSESYVTETVVDTNANVIVLGLERLSIGPTDQKIVGVDFTQGQLGEETGRLPWAIVASTTRIGSEWSQTLGDATQDHFTILDINTNKPVGAAGILFELDVDPDLGLIGWFDPSLDDYDPVGYAYQDFGVVKYGSHVNWLMEFVEGAPNNYFDANFSIDPTMWDLGSPGEGVRYLRLTPGGCISSTWEFIPYGLQVDATLDDMNGTYAVDAYDPPITADRDIICAEISYADGRADVVFADWNPAGTTLPDLTFGIPPECDEILLSPGLEVLNANWTNNPVEGILMLELSGWTETPFWRIYADDDATGLPADAITVPPPSLAYLAGLNSTGLLVRVACTGVSMDGFDRATIWEDATSFAKSTPESVGVEPPIPEP